MVSIPACIFWLVLIFPVQVYEAPLHALDLLQLYLQLLCTQKKTQIVRHTGRLGGAKAGRKTQKLVGTQENTSDGVRNGVERRKWRVRN